MKTTPLIIVCLFLTSCGVIETDSEESLCPQLELPVTKTNGIIPYLQAGEYDGWTVGVWSSNQLLGMNIDNIYCEEGRLQGQNVNHYYCGFFTPYGYMTKQSVDEEGQIQDIIRQTFYNEYDQDLNYIRTVCGTDPTA